MGKNPQNNTLSHMNPKKQPKTANKHQKPLETKSPQYYYSQKTIKNATQTWNPAWRPMP